MGFRVPPNTATYTAQVDIEHGLLLSLCAIAHEFALSPGAVWVAGGLGRRDHSPDVIHTMLFSGFVHQRNSPCWTGQLVIEPYDVIRAVLRTSTQCNVLVTGRAITGAYPIVTLEP